MLADVAQKVQAVHAAEPVGVVFHDGGVCAVKFQKRRKLVFDAFQPACHGFGRVQAAFYGFEAGVANHAGCAAHQRHRRVPRVLEAAQYQHGQQMPDVQAVGGGVKAAVERDFFVVQQLGEFVDVGGLGNQPAGFISFRFPIKGSLKTVQAAVE